MATTGKKSFEPKEIPPCWLPADYEPGDASALQALAAGIAEPFQQKRALDWIINKCAGTYGLGWHPAGAADAAFVAGQRNVGTQIVKLLNINVSVLVKDK